MSLKKLLLFSLLLFFPSFVILPRLGLFVPTSVEADELSDKQKDIDQLVQKLSELGKQKSSLKNEIAIMDSQIRLTSLKIQQTLGSINLLEEQIEELSVKIGKLDQSLDSLSLIFLSRVSESYRSQTVSPFSLFLSSSSFGDFYRKLKYLKALQLNDRVVMIKLEEARSSFDRQKQEREEKQQQLENLKKTLDSQKKALENEKSKKAYLLQATKNDEKRYQQLLAQARAEYQAIQAVLAGGGDETEVGLVSKGETIATIIAGSSCNSSGSHLHFSVTQGNNVVNPFNYLRGGVSWEDCSGSSCGSSDGDPFNPSGSWDWPMDEKITFTQGFGATWAINNKPWIRQIYTSHNGIDIYNQSLRVKSVANGTLYRGSYTGIGSCQLRYVRVNHQDSDIETYYLHINYTKL